MPLWAYNIVVNAMIAQYSIVKISHYTLMNYFNIIFGVVLCEILAVHQSLTQSRFASILPSSV